MLCHLIASLVFGQTAQPQDPPFKPIYPQIISRTTGNNGYEEYVRAADMIRDRRIGLLTVGVFSAPEPNTPAPPFLQSRKKLLAEGQKVLEVVRAGNRKAVFEPREKLDVATSFPEFAYFKNIVRLFTVESYVRYSAANPSGGLASLLDGLTFSQKISQTTLISSLVSIACTSIILGEANNRVQHMSEAEAQRVIAFVDDHLAQPDPTKRALDGERMFMASALDGLLDHPEQFLSGFGFEADTSDTNAAVIKEIKALTSQQKQVLRQRMLRRLNEAWDKVVARMAQPPSSWAVHVKPDEPQDANLEDFIASILEPGTFAQGMMANGKRLAQLGLFRLHAAIIQFRWHHNRLPRDLKELGLPAYTKDPLSDGEYVYEVKSDGVYELYSKGYSSTGPIHLKYQRPPGLGDEKNFEPPLSRSRL